MLAVLRELEHKYKQEVVTIGVHSAKFAAEKEIINLRPAVRRLRIGHPVVNDKDFRVWQEYAVHSWPTLIFIDPVGRVIGKHEGGIPFAALGRLVEDMVRDFDARGMLNRAPLLFQQEIEPTFLYFPGKVLADSRSGRLFIADTGHHRIVIAGLDGRVQQVIGAGGPGYRDGSFATCSFDAPQGMALLGESLFVADTENHVVRRVDLRKGIVETIAGTSDQGRPRVRRGLARQVPLSSPWDLAVRRDTLYIAMAGFHQLWALDLVGETMSVFAGTGHEGIRDGSRERAWLAQPSGLTIEDERLYFADSESSAIRWVDLGPKAEAGTIVGLGLFDFGDVDGTGDAVLLQHPLGVAVLDGVLYVADTYNHKIKQVFPSTRETTTFAGSGVPGNQDGIGRAAGFHEPGGISAAEGRLYVADTDNHAIRVIDLTTGEVRTLEIRE